jgi:2-dehydropantoate 2-reductase
MRYVIYGAGAIGGIVGAQLFKHGFDVLLIARGSHLEAIKRDGLCIRDAEGEERYRIPVVSHPSEIAFTPDDCVILGMKTQDSAAAIEDLEAAAGGLDLPLVCTQNGLETERLALRRFDSVYGMYVFLPATFLEPGIVDAWAGPSPGLLDLGTFPDGSDSTAEAIAADLEQSRFTSAATPKIERWKWAKLISIINNGLEAVVGPEADAKDLEKAITDESTGVLRDAGIDFASSDEVRERRNQAKGMNSRGTRPGASTWQSLVRGTGSVEVDYLNGEIVLAARLHGLQAPLNEAVRRLANKCAREHITPGTYSVDDVRKLADSLRR